MSQSKKKVKNIWDLISFPQLVTAIASLGHRVDQLAMETWRLHADFDIQSSLWAQIIAQLELKHTEKIRHSFYNVWLLNRDNIHALVKKKIKIMKHKKDEDNVDMNENDASTTSNLIKSKLIPEQSLPIPDRPNTRANKAQKNDQNCEKNETNEKITFALNPIEWKTAFSNSKKKMNNGWTRIFYEKIKASGIVCVVKFGKPHIPEGQRKKICKQFWCRAICTGSSCTRSYLIALENKPDVYTAALFSMEISGVENHTPQTEIMTLQLRGEERLRVGKVFLS